MNKSWHLNQLKNTHTKENNRWNSFKIGTNSRTGENKVKVKKGTLVSNNWRDEQPNKGNRTKNEQGGANQKDISNKKTSNWLLCLS